MSGGLRRPGFFCHPPPPGGGRLPFPKRGLLGMRRLGSIVASPDSNLLVCMMLTRTGLLPLFVLSLMASKPRFGNEIMREIEDRTHGAWTANPAAVYPLLRHLEALGLVEGRWETKGPRPRRTYAITDQGRQELANLRGFLEPKVRDAMAVLRDISRDLFGQNGVGREVDSDSSDSSDSREGSSGGS